ncbi:MAG: hypothetical protein KZQ83_01555 [gamma proteobacterium symbiont of Taylorina sp.]|nr:hypothetical protein [gamma proteobacterium symbiont of Taylorina sp.]
MVNKKKAADVAGIVLFSFCSGTSSAGDYIEEDPEINNDSFISKITLAPEASIPGPSYSSTRSVYRSGSSGDVGAGSSGDAGTDEPDTATTSSSSGDIGAGSSGDAGTDEPDTATTSSSSGDIGAGSSGDAGYVEMILSSSVSEGDGSTFATVKRRDCDSSSPAISVDYFTSPGTATEGADFYPESGTLTWGSSGDCGSYGFEVNIIDDSIFEQQETFSVSLTNPTNGSYINGEKLVRVSILDDDTYKVEKITGEVFLLTSTDASIPNTTSTFDIGAMFTLKDSSISIRREDGNLSDIQPNTLTVFNPSTTDNSIAIIKGKVTSTVSCVNTNSYDVLTALATVSVSESCSQALSRVSNIPAKFTTDYSQNGLDGTLKVTVISGSVDIIDKNGNISSLSAGEEKTIQERVPRTSWVLPVDNDKMYGGKDNFFTWTEYAGADRYLIEVNLPSPVFYEENPASPEYPEQTLVLTSKSYINYDGLVIFVVPLPKGYEGIVLEVRVYALDADDNIIGESVSSDRRTITVKD